SPIRKLRASQWTQQPGLYEFQGESTTGLRFDSDARAGKRCVNGIRDRLFVPDFYDRLNRRSHIRAIMAQDGRASAEFGNPARCLGIRAELIIKPPAP